MSNPYENILRNNTNYSTGNPAHSLCKFRWDQPTIDLHKSQIRLCCRVPALNITDGDLKTLGTDAILNNSYLLDRRKEMFQGIKHLDCAPCWKAEASGQPSPRVGASELLKKGAKLNLKGDFSTLSIDDPILKSKNPTFLEVQLGNICDLKCVYCWRGNSSKWAQEDLAFGKISQEEYEKFDIKPSEQFETTFWNWLKSNASELQMVSFVGGEPTLQKNFGAMLLRTHEACVDAKNKSAKIRIVTNLNCEQRTLESLTETIRKITSLGRQVLIDVSMESFGERAEFIRYGLRWNKFESNLEHLLSLNIPNFQVAVSATINALSVTSFKDFLIFLKNKQAQFNKKIPILENSVVDPIWLAPEILTPDFKKYLSECIEILKSEKFQSDFSWGYGWNQYAKYVEKINATIRFSRDTDDKNIVWTRSRFLSGIKELEKRRSLNFLEIFPEMSDLYRGEI